MSDIIQSLSIILGPFAVPRSSDSRSTTTVVTGFWASGNNQTCQANGFLFGVTAGCTPMHMLGLCVYSAMKIKKRNMTDDDFFNKVEKFMHIIIFTTNISLVVFGLSVKAINSSALGNICLFAFVPTGCRQRPSIFGECVPEIAKYVPTLLVFISNIGIPSACLFGIIVSMSIICMHALKIRGYATDRDFCSRRFSPFSSLRATKKARSPAPSSSVEITSRGAMMRSRHNILCTTGRRMTEIRRPAADPRDGASDESDSTHSGEENPQGLIVHINSNFHKNLIGHQQSSLQKSGGEDHHRVIASNSISQLSLPCSVIDNLADENILSQVSTTTKNISSPKTGTVSCLQQASTNHDQGVSSHRIVEHEEEEDTEAKVNQIWKEIILQAWCFVSAFFITFFFWWVMQYILVVQQKIPSVFVVRVTSALYPLGDFFNFLAFSRPKIVSLRMKHPEYSWLRSFWCIIKAGGDTPKESGLSRRGVFALGFNHDSSNADAPGQSAAFGVVAGEDEEMT